MYEIMNERSKTLCRRTVVEFSMNESRAYLEKSVEFNPSMGIHIAEILPF